MPPGAEYIPLTFEVQHPGFGVIDWHTGDGQTVYEIPCFIAQDGNGDPLFMHWFNTMLRIFPTVESANHVDYTTEQGNTVGVIVTPELFQAFRDNNYPEEVWPIVDPSSVRWLADRAMKELEVEIDGIGDGLDES